MEIYRIDQYDKDVVLVDAPDSTYIRVPDDDISIDYDMGSYMEDPDSFINQQVEEHKKYYDLMGDVVNVAQKQSRYAYDAEKEVEDVFSILPDFLIPVIRTSFKSSMLLDSIKSMKSPKRILRESISNYMLQDETLKQMRGAFETGKSFYATLPLVSAELDPETHSVTLEGSEAINESIDDIIRRYDRILRSRDATVLSTSKRLDMIYGNIDLS